MGLRGDVGWLAGVRDTNKQRTSSAEYKYGTWVGGRLGCVVGSGAGVPKASTDRIAKESIQRMILVEPEALRPSPCL